MTAQHQTNEQVIHSITDTLLSLLKTQMMEEIRIVDLVRLAGVSRNSFYRNFKDKDDVLRHYISEVTDIWYQKVNRDFLSHKKDYQFFVPLLHYLHEHRDLASILIRNGKLILLKEEFDRRALIRLNGVEDLAYLTNANKNTDEAKAQSDSETNNEYRDNSDQKNQAKILSVQDYLEHVYGKRSYTSYAELLSLWRDTFINIDDMILEELKNLFMLIW